MVTRLRGLGWWCTYVESDAIDFLSPVHRKRLYWPLLNSLKIPAMKDFNAVDKFFYGIFNNLKVCIAGSITDSIIIIDAERARLSEAAGFPLLKGSGIKPEGGGQPHWKTVHLEYFQEWEMEWPVEVSRYLFIEGIRVLNIEFQRYARPVNKVPATRSWSRVAFAAYAFDSLRS